MRTGALRLDYGGVTRKSIGLTPVLLATRVDDVHVYVWCPFCQDEHLHALAPGHRVAHCWQRWGRGTTAPRPRGLAETGYYVALPPSVRRSMTPRQAATWTAAR